MTTSTWSRGSSTTATIGRGIYTRTQPEEEESEDAIVVHNFAWDKLGRMTGFTRASQEPTAHWQWEEPAREPAAVSRSYAYTYLLEQRRGRARRPGWDADEL